MEKNNPNHPQRDDQKKHAQPQQPGHRQPPPRTPEQQEAQPRKASTGDELEGWIPD